MKSLFLFLIFFCFSSVGEEIKFEKKRISIGSKVLQVEVADTHKKITRGLMFRHEKLKGHQGMLFVFKDEQMRSFWMKNTFIPLSIGFFNKEKKLVSIRKMKPVKSEMEKPFSYRSGKPAKYALEVDQGWFERNKIKLGTKFRFLK